MHREIGFKLKISVMKNFQGPLRKIVSRDELRKIRGGGNCAPLPIGTTEGAIRRSVKCCTDATLLCCSSCITLDLSAHCSGGNFLMNC